MSIEAKLIVLRVDDSMETGVADLAVLAASRSWSLEDMDVQFSGKDVS